MSKSFPQNKMHYSSMDYVHYYDEYKKYIESNDLQGQSKSAVLKAQDYWDDRNINPLGIYIYICTYILIIY